MLHHHPCHDSTFFHQCNVVQWFSLWVATCAFRRLALGIATWATLWLHCGYTATHLVQVSTALQGESVCACVRVPGALQNSSVPPQAARVTLVKRFHSFHVMKISAFQNLTKMCKYQCEIFMNGHLFDMLFLSVEVFRQASCNVANLRSGAESAELATHWQCLSCVSCASYTALFACVHVLLSPTKSSQANSECNFKDFIAFTWTWKTLQAKALQWDL